MAVLPHPFLFPISRCFPIHFAFGVKTSRQALKERAIEVILYHLKDEPKRYSELHKEMPSVTEMTLSLQLKQLEKDGLISRKVHGRKPPIKVVYSLTDFGKSFVPIL